MPDDVCLEKLPDFSEYDGIIIDISSTYTRFKQNKLRWRKWRNKLKNQSQRNKTYICSTGKDGKYIHSKCIEIFEKRNTMQNIRKDQDHIDEHKEKNVPFIQQTLFIIDDFPNARMRNISSGKQYRKDPICLIGEKRVAWQALMNFFKPVTTKKVKRKKNEISQDENNNNSNNTDANSNSNNNNNKRRRISTASTGSIGISSLNINATNEEDTESGEWINLFATISDLLLSDKIDCISSLYGPLKTCQTSMGDRLLSIWIRQPLVDINAIYRRQKLIKLFVENHEPRQLLRDQYLKSLIDLEKLQKEIQQNTAALRDLVDLYKFADKIPSIIDALNATKDISFEQDPDITPLSVLVTDFIDPIRSLDENFNNFLAMIESVVDIPDTSKQEYFIKHEFDDLLHEINKRMGETMKDMEQCTDKAIWEKLSKSYIEYERRYNQREKSIVDKTIEITKSYIPVIQSAISVFGELDIILSLSAIYSPSLYVLPKIYPSGSDGNKFIKMKNARHPSLESMQLDNVAVVIPNYIELIGDKSSFKIVTIPNVGGKSGVVPDRRICIEIHFLKST